MSTVAFDIRNDPVIKLSEEDIATLYGEGQISVNVFNYLLQASTLVQGPRDYVALTSTDFLDERVESDLRMYNNMNWKKGQGMKSTNLSRRLSLLEKWEDHKFTLLIPMVKGDECAFLVVKVSDSIDVLSYDDIIIYSIYNNNRPRTRNNSNLSTEEEESLRMVDRWLAVCLERSSNKMNKIKAVVTRRSRPDIMSNPLDARLLCATIALKYCEDPLLDDVSVPETDVSRLRNHLKRKLPLEERIHIVKRLGREMYEILSGRTIEHKSGRRNALQTTEEERGPPIVQRPAQLTDLLSDEYLESLPRKERMYDPHRERDYRRWKRLKLEKMKARIRNLTDMLNDEDLTSESAFMKSVSGKPSNATDELNALMSSSSEDSDDRINEEKKDPSRCKNTTPTTSTTKRTGSGDGQEEVLFCLPVNVPDRSGEPSNEFREARNISKSGKRDGWKGYNNVDAVNDNKKGDYSDGDGHGGDWNTNVVNTAYDGDTGMDVHVNAMQGGRADNPTEIANGQDYYEEPRRKRKTPYLLSVSTPDSECFTDPTLLPEAGKKFYNSIEEAQREIMDYTVRTGFYIAFNKSTPRYLRGYCKSHEGCPCHVQVGAVPFPEGCFVVKKVDRRHKDTDVIVRGKGGRRFKQRNRVYASSSYTRVNRNIAGRPKPNDVRTSGRNEDGVDLSYSAGQRTVRRNRSLEAARADKSYQQLSGFLESFAHLNPGSVVDIQHDDDDRVSKVFVCPGIMESRLKFVKRVVLIDACHRYSYGGTMYLATVYSANQEVYPIAVGLTSINESEEGWTYFLTLLKKACPSLSTVEDSSFVRGADVLGFEQQEDGREAFQVDRDDVNELEEEDDNDSHDDNLSDYDDDFDDDYDIDNDEPDIVGETLDSTEQSNNADVFDVRGLATLQNAPSNTRRRSLNLSVDVPDQTNRNNLSNGMRREENTITQIESDDDNNIQEEDANDPAVDDEEKKQSAVNNVGQTTTTECDGSTDGSVPVFRAFGNSDAEGTNIDHPSGMEDGQGENNGPAGNDNDTEERHEDDGESKAEGSEGSDNGEEYEYDPNQTANDEQVPIDLIENMTPEEALAAIKRDMWMMVESRSNYNWLFVSDRDKGMAKAVSKVFPNVHPTNCSVHIRRNVLNAHGREASTFVQKIAASFLATEEEKLFGALELVSERAVKYLKEIRPSLWRNTAFMDPLLPPRYNILSSNGVESANSMFAPAREGPWLHALQSILFDMSKRIMNHRKEYEKSDGKRLTNKLYSKVYANFKAANSYDVMATVNGTFVVTYINDNGTTGAMHKVKPSIATCSCGQWHSTLLPCRHAMAWARQVQDWSFETICKYMCSYVHFNRAASELYSVGFDLVVPDSIRYDNKSLPNEIVKQSGRSAKQRYRPRSKFGNPDESTRKCKRCRQRGHNIRTCSVPDNELIGMHSVN